MNCLIGFICSILLIIRTINKKKFTMFDVFLVSTGLSTVVIMIMNNVIY